MYTCNILYQNVTPYLHLALYEWSRSCDQDGVAKTFKNLLQNQKSYDFETWHAASGIQALQRLMTLG